MDYHFKHLKLVQNILSLSNEVDDVQREKIENQLKFKQEILRCVHYRAVAANLSCSKEIDLRINLADHLLLPWFIS